MGVTPFLADADFTLYQGDVRQVLAGLEAESVHCVVTSPPYWGLRDYGTGSWEGGDEDCDHLPPMGDAAGLQSSTLEGGKKTTAHQQTGFKDVCGKCGASRIDNQLGLEATPDEYLDNMVQVFREVRRVLRSDGTCWLNIGDSYTSTAEGTVNAPERIAGAGGRDGKRGQARARYRPVTGLKPKDLCMIPARLALALQADGWWLRSQIIWSKPNPMPESVTDRPTTSHEYVYLLAKSPRYFFDQEAVREPHESTRWGGKYSGPGTDDWKNGSRIRERDERDHYPSGGRNIRSVWEIPTQPYPEAHFATYPEELVRRCVLAGTSERGCCRECGAPWERELEGGEGTYAERKALGYDKPANMKPGVHGGGHGIIHPPGMTHDLDAAPRKTTGWRPSCNHNLEPVPCTVLDPFGGSGTTALVARKHGRRSVLVELNEQYCELAARRLQQLSLLAETS